MTRANHCILIFLVLWASTNAQWGTGGPIGPGGGGPGGPRRPGGPGDGWPCVDPWGKPIWPCYDIPPKDDIVDPIKIGAGSQCFCDSFPSNLNIGTIGPVGNPGDENCNYYGNTKVSQSFCCCKYEGCCGCQHSTWCVR